MQRVADIELACRGNQFGPWMTALSLRALSSTTTIAALPSSAAVRIYEIASGYFAAAPFDLLPFDLELRMRLVYETPNSRR